MVLRQCAFESRDVFSVAAFGDAGLLRPLVESLRACDTTGGQCARTQYLPTDDLAETLIARESFAQLSVAMMMKPGTRLRSTSSPVADATVQATVH